MQFLLRKSGEGLANATRKLGQAVQDAGSAATLAVDDLNRHTIERVKTQVKSKVGAMSARTLLQEAPSVYVRLRPTSTTVPPTEERLSNSERVVRIAAEHPAMAPLSFVLDGVMGVESDQAATYAAVGAKAIEGLLQGESTTLIAFGDSGSGKSYTLFGPPDLLSNPSGSAWQGWGLLPRASHHLFSRASAVGGVEGLLGPGSSVSCSFLEVRDECIHDLLGKGHGLRLRESASLGVHVPDATKRLVEWEEDVMRALVIGLQKRSSPRDEGGASTHAIFTLTLRRRNADGGMRECSLQLVDLGSAEARRPGTARSVAPPTNVSLAALNRCVNALAENSPHQAKQPSIGEPNPQAIPYRESKLTWLLRDALGGAAGVTHVHTTFIALCSTELQQLPSTINSLRFAHRCRQARLWVARAATRPTEALQITSNDGTPREQTSPPPPEQHLRSPPSMPVPAELTSTMLSMKLGPGPDSESSDEGEEEQITERAREALAALSPSTPGAVVSSPPVAIPLASLSERSKETAELRQRLAAVQAQVAVDASASPPAIQNTDGWEQLQSAHAHMLLLEARLAELSQPASS